MAKKTTKKPEKKPLKKAEKPEKQEAKKNKLPKYKQELSRAEVSKLPKNLKEKRRKYLKAEAQKRYIENNKEKRKETLEKYENKVREKKKQILESSFSQFPVVSKGHSNLVHYQAFGYGEEANKFANNIMDESREKGKKVFIVVQDGTKEKKFNEYVKQPKILKSNFYIDRLFKNLFEVSDKHYKDTGNYIYTSIETLNTGKETIIKIILND